MEIPSFQSFASLGLPSQLALSATVLYALYVATQKATAKISKGNEPPGIWGIPLLGTAHEFMGEDAYAFSRGRPGMWRTKLFGTQVTIVQSSEHSEAVFRGEGRTIGSFLPPQMVGIFGTNAMVCASGEPHKKLRQAMLSCFQPSVLKLSSTPIQDIMSRHLRLWEEAGTIDGYNEPMKTAFDFGTSFVGLDVSKMTAEARAEIMKNTLLMAKGATAVPVDLGRYSRFGRGRIAASEVRRIMAGVVAKRRKLVKQLEAAGEPLPNDMLQRLVSLKMEDGTPLEEDVLLENMAFFIFASFETTAGILAAFVLCMCRYPDVQERAHQHIREVLSSDNDELDGTKPIHADRWREFEYIDQVLGEVERVHPPMPNVSWRTASTDVELGGYSINKGTQFLINALGRTQDPAYWKEPTKFDPERFSPERMEHKTGLGKNYKLATFGGGGRQCIGMGLANYERKIFAVLALRDYKFSFAEAEPAFKTRYEFAFVIDNLSVKVDRR